MINVRQNTDLLISQWRTAPRLQALAAGLLGAIQEGLIDPLTTLEESQNLEQASGAALNDIGERIGIARTREVPTDLEFFGFDNGGTGFDQAPFFTSIIGYLLVEDEADSAFREAMRARGRTLLSGTSLTEFINALEGSETQYESIVDNRNGTFTITVTRQTEKNRINDLIERKALPVPAGIGVNIAVSVTTGDHVFWGTATDPNDLTGFIAGTTGTPYAHDLQRLQMPTFSGNAHLVFVQRSSDADITSITINGFEQIAAFNHRPAAITENGVDYDAWITDLEIVGSKVAGAVVEIRR